MVADILLLVLGSFLLIVGFLGCFLPVIPGPPISFIGMIILRFTSFVEENRVDAYNELLWIFAGATIIVTVLDYIVPIWGTKKFGGSRAGTIGATIGLIIGLFFGPPGIIIGPFVGAVVGEMATGRNEKESLRAGFGSLIGFLTGVVLKLVVSSLAAFYFIREAIVS